MTDGDGTVHGELHGKVQTELCMNLFARPLTLCEFLLCFGVCAPQHSCGSQRTTFGNRLSHSTLTSSGQQTQRPLMADPSWVI